MPAELKIVENNKESLGYDPLLTPEQVAEWLNTYAGDSGERAGDRQRDQR